MMDLSQLFAAQLKQQSYPQRLAQQASSTEPTAHWTGALARALQGGMAGMYQRRDRARAGEEFDAMYPDSAPMAAALAGGNAPPPMQPQQQAMPQAAPPGPMVSALSAPPPMAPPPQMAAMDAGPPVNIPRPPVMPGPKVWGDAEAEAAGLYEGAPKPNFNQRFAGGPPNALPPQAAPVSGPPSQAMAQALQGGPPQGQPPMPPQPAPPPVPAPPPQMAQAQMPPQVPPQAQQRVAPQIPPDLRARARRIATSDDPYGEAKAAAMLAPYTKPKDQTRPMTPDERKQWQVPDGMSAGINAADGKPVFSPPQTNVAVNSVADPIREGVGKQFVEGRKNANSAARTMIPTIHEARSALDQGAITGTAADIRTQMQKVGSLFGMSANEASNTEVFRATIGRQVLAHAKELGANPSNADRDFIKEVEAGDIKLEEKTLRRLLDISERMARQSIKNHNADAEKLIATQPDAYKGVAPLLLVDDPPPYAPPQKADAPAANPGRVRRYNPATGKIE